MARELWTEMDSDRTGTDRALEHPIRLTRAFFDQSPVAMVWLHGRDGDWDWQEANEAAHKMFGAPIDPFRGYGHLVFTSDGQPLAPHELPECRALRGERVVELELLIRNGDDDFVPVAARASPIIGRFETIVGAVVTFRELTAAEEAERLRAEWNAVVAHDLRQPLGSISLNAQALARATRDPHLLKHAERIRCATDRLQRMVGDLMDASRLEARRLELVRRPVNIREVARACVERFTFETTGRPFELHIEDGVPEACADPERITQVLENLLTNAVKYGAPGTPIVLRVAHRGRVIVVAVTNHGQGLTEAEISQLFARFRRTASARRGGPQGIGLGLYIARSLVEAHGGLLTAESADPGTTTFRFTLPVP